MIPAIILARKGSKGIKNKNLRIVNGKPLIYWTISACKKSNLISKTYVSTNCKKIKNYSIKLGAEIIDRPDIYAKSNSSSEIAWRHAILEILNRKKISPKIAIVLQLTSPVRGKKDLDRAVEYFKKKKLDSLFSSCLKRDFCLWEIKNSKFYANYDYQNRLPRQKIQKTYLENGSFYIFNVKKFLKYNCRLFGKIGTYKIDSYKSIQVDEPDDLKIADALLKSLNNCSAPINN